MGFLGGGLYKDIKGQEILGSQLRVLETIERLKKEITFERENKNFGKINFDIPVYCIEKDRNVFKFLKQTINQRGFGNSANIINGEFEKIYNNIIKELQSKEYKRAVFLLDQYGCIETIKTILNSFYNIEIILAFA
ncbi:three-Cys-motif partner protein TcmP [uncultured Brachyspira sp.]|jgi:three-Cys-motif partner protein|uniref:three-Cys-motif partner protein TcmP n=1 Tax=uncultured Brachyspira sp. TaxID=221953 RepID=UPI0025892837|nr:three-Cys-motif partner protein TcmP [uncultured Brachyspira sp.]